MGLKGGRDNLSRTTARSQARTFACVAGLNFKVSRRKRNTRCSLSSSVSQLWAWRTTDTTLFVFLLNETHIIQIITSTEETPGLGNGCVREKGLSKPNILLYNPPRRGQVSYCLNGTGRTLNTGPPVSLGLERWHAPSVEPREHSHWFLASWKLLTTVFTASPKNPGWESGALNRKTLSLSLIPDRFSQNVFVRDRYVTRHNSASHPCHCGGLVCLTHRNTSFAHQVRCLSAGLHGQHWGLVRLCSLRGEITHQCLLPWTLSHTCSPNPWS